MTAAAATKAVALVTLVILHRGDGATVAVNPRHTSSLTPAAPGLMSGKVHCVIHLHGGKWMSVRETCAEVYAKFEGKP